MPPVEENEINIDKYIEMSSDPSQKLSNKKKGGFKKMMTNKHKVALSTRINFWGRNMDKSDVTRECHRQLYSVLKTIKKCKQ